MFLVNAEEIGTAAWMTGVQTCALPISLGERIAAPNEFDSFDPFSLNQNLILRSLRLAHVSRERRGDRNSGLDDWSSDVCSSDLLRRTHCRAKRIRFI